MLSNKKERKERRNTALRPKNVLNNTILNTKVNKMKSIKSIALILTACVAVAVTDK